MLFINIIFEKRNHNFIVNAVVLCALTKNNRFLVICVVQQLLSAKIFAYTATTVYDAFCTFSQDYEYLIDGALLKKSRVVLNFR